MQTVAAQTPEEQSKGVAQAAGFSLHAGIGTEAEARGKLERLVRYPVKRDERCLRSRSSAAGVAVGSSR